MQPLAGVIFLDFSTLLPGPLATLMLASGAEVTLHGSSPRYALYPTADHRFVGLDVAENAVRGKN
jgi:crotonobetainyl-CoA:carnitine CoA-transferase CaiB-like acyl-CoA transferase